MLAALLAIPAAAQDMPGMAMPATSPTTTDPHAGRDMSAMPGMDHASMDHASMNHTMAMTGALGPYPMTREASGTSWQPDAGDHMGAMTSAGGWHLMGHATFNLVYDHQSGPRGADKGFVSGMIMGMAMRDLSPRDTLQLRAMLSPDPLMGKSGYPILLAAGETANGTTTLVDRQHPHDLFMELSASLSHRIGDRGSVFLYAGLPGEPAFGPPAFMHRQSIMNSPEAPISHHWLDSTHITYGVVTAGVTWGGVKAEISRFKGREPDQYRYDIESPKFDSTAARLSWNPSGNWSLQGSYARQKSPEQLEPDDDQDKWSASAIYTRKVGPGSVAATIAWGRKQTIEADGHRHAPQDAFIAEASWTDRRWTVFGRGEVIESDELLAPPGAAHGPVYTVGKASLGAIRDFEIAGNIRFGLGALVARSVTPAPLDQAYGGDRTSGMAFVRLKVG